jgi:hypothetical protein
MTLPANPQDMDCVHCGEPVDETELTIGDGLRVSEALTSR